MANFGGAGMGAVSGAAAGSALGPWGTAAGGILGGLSIQYASREIVAIILIATTMLWLLWTLRLNNPYRYAHLYLPIDAVDQTKLNSLEHEHIAEWFINESEQIVAIKYRKDLLDQEEVKEKCSAYEHTIDNLGGIDLQVLGIGKNGHIGFNEPGSSFHSKTRVIHLDQQTRIANTYEFLDLNKVEFFILSVLSIYFLLRFV